MATLLARYATSTTAVFTSADVTLAVASKADFPDLGADDHTYISLLDTTGDLLEVCRVSGVQSQPGLLTGLTRGQSGTTARRWPAGTAVAITDDPKLLQDFVADHVVAAGEGGLSRPQVLSLIKSYAQAGSNSKIPWADMQSAADLTAKDHDSIVDAGDRIPLVGPSESVDAKISAYELREYVKDDISEQLIPEGGTTDQVLAKRSGTNFDLKWKDDAEGSGGDNVPENRQIPAGGTTDQVLAKSSNSDYAVKWKDDETGTSTTVDTDRLVPAGGSQGQVLRKKTATDYDDEWGDAPGLDGTEVNRRIAARVPDGGSAGQVLKKASATDGDTEWGEDRTNPANIPTGPTFPTNPTAGDRFLLTHGTSQIDDHVLEVVQSQTTLRQLHLGGGSNLPNYIRSYASNYSGPSATTLRGKTFVVYSGSGASNPPSRLHFYDPGSTRVIYTVSGTSAGAGLLNYYEVTGLTYTLFSVGAHETNIQYADGTRFFEDAPISVGDYTYTGTRWDFTPGVAASWAAQGEPEPVGTEVPENRQIPSGGSTGQVLKKTSGTDYAVAWQADDDEQTASEVPVDTSDVPKPLTVADDNVQKALKTLAGPVAVDRLPDDLQLIDRNVVRGGWRSEPLFLVLEADARSAAYDRDTARGFQPQSIRGILGLHCTDGQHERQPASPRLPHPLRLQADRAGIDSVAAGIGRRFRGCDPSHRGHVLGRRFRLESAVRLL